MNNNEQAILAESCTNTILTNNLQNIIDIRNKIFTLKKTKINYLEPLLIFNGYGCIYSNSITIIQGKSGSHKSRLCETLICELIKNNKNVLLADTERNQSDHLPHIIQNIQNSLNIPLDEDIPYFDCISLITTERKERKQALKEYIEFTKFEGVVFIDVATDLVVDFNNIYDTNDFFDYINQMMKNNNIAFVLVIHENPNHIDNKARGHLGTEAKNKASIVISIQNDKEKLSVKYQKSRHSKLPIEYNMEYNVENNLLKILDLHIDNTDEMVRQVLIESFPSISKSKLFDKLSQVLNRKDHRSINTYLDKYNKWQIEIDGKQYQLIYSKTRPIMIEYCELSIENNQSA